jgi:hypothetical protein
MEFRESTSTTRSRLVHLRFVTTKYRPTDFGPLRNKPNISFGKGQRVLAIEERKRRPKKSLRFGHIDARFIASC